MQRREFIAGLGAAITGSIQTDAQELLPVPLVGYLDDGSAEGFIFRQVIFRKGLAQAGYFEGCNVAIEAHRGRLPDWASDLVDRSAAVLVASGSVSAILAAKAATTTIPIVFGFGADPIETGLVSSLDRPGGNITGVTSMTVDIGSKRLGLLRDLLPRATRVAVLVDPTDDVTVVNSMIADVRGAAIPIGLEIEVFYAGDVGDIDTAFASLVERQSWTPSRVQTTWLDAARLLDREHAAELICWARGQPATLGRQATRVATTFRRIPLAGRRVHAGLSERGLRGGQHSTMSDPLIAAESYRKDATVFSELLFPSSYLPSL